MRKIVSPWKRIPEFQCFGCSESNPNGLQMKFEVGEDGEIISRWHPRDYFQGWHNVLHGGIQCTLMDEICAWVVFHELHTMGMTAKLDTKFIKSIYTTDKELLIKAKMTKSAHGMAWIDASITNSNGEVCATASAIYKAFDQKIASEQYNFSELKYEDEDK